MNFIPLYITLRFKIQYENKPSKCWSWFCQDKHERANTPFVERFSAHSCAALLSLGITLQDKEVLFCSWMRQDELRALQSLESSPVSLTERKQYFGRVTILFLVSFFFNKSKNEENLAMGPWTYRMSYDL